MRDTEEAMEVVRPEAVGAARISSVERALAPAQKLTEEERLTIENSHLKQQNIQLQVAHIDREREKALALLQTEQAKFKGLLEQLSAKYGVLIGPSTVKPDGTIVVPRG